MNTRPMAVGSLALVIFSLVTANCGLELGDGSGDISTDNSSTGGPLRWYRLCPLNGCASLEAPACSIDIEGSPCVTLGPHCDPGIGCGVYLQCTFYDPKPVAGCKCAPPYYDLDHDPYGTCEYFCDGSAPDSDCDGKADNETVDGGAGGGEPCANSCADVDTFDSTICAGDTVSQTFYDALWTCLCGDGAMVTGACAAECGDTRCVAMAPSDPCNACITAALGDSNQCQKQYFDCLNDL